MTGNHEDAEYVPLDVFLSVYRASNRYRGESEITTRVYAIAVNAALHVPAQVAAIISGLPKAALPT